MSAWTSTTDKILNTIAYLFTRATQRLTTTLQERQIITDAINEALVQVVVSRGVARWRFATQETSVQAAGGSREVLLPANTLTVISGTVKIASQQTLLYKTSLECIEAADPAQEQEGLPVFYALDSTSDPNTPRLLLAPIPDQDYTLDLRVESLFDSDATAAFPSWLHGPITDLATAIAMRRLGFGTPELYQRAYEDGELNASHKTGDDGPQHIQRNRQAIYPRGLEHRIVQS